MKILRLWPVVAIFSGILPRVAVAQETAKPLVTPSKVSGTTNTSRPLISGGEFHFILTFDKAPEKYLDGSMVRAQFERVSDDPPPPFKGEDYEEKSDWAREEPLQNGQIAYSMTLGLNMFMPSGKWKLTRVLIGRRAMDEIPISGEVSFEIAKIPPFVVHVHAPKSVEAGYPYVFTVTLDEYPKDIPARCILYLVPRVNSEDWDGAQLTPDKLSYEFSHPFDPEAPSRSWEGEMVLVTPGQSAHTLPVSSTRGRSPLLVRCRAK